MAIKEMVFSLLVSMGWPNLEPPIIIQVPKEQLPVFWFGSENGYEKNFQNLGNKQFQKLTERLMAIYRPKGTINENSYIFVRDDIAHDNPVFRSVLYHELIHHIQFEVDYHLDFVPCRRKLEKYAYTKQMEWNQQNSIPFEIDGFTIVINSMCPNEWGN